MELKIIAPITAPLNEFKTVDEFELFYSKHKEEMDATTTHKLNKMYTIENYRITKIQGKLMLKRWEKGKTYYQKKVTPQDERLDALESQVTEFDERLGEIEKDDKYQKQIDVIRNLLNEMIAALKERGVFG
jgi:hypothetical protein